MTKLKLTSNFVNDILHDVGKASLQNDLITITTEPGTSATLLRGSDKVLLLKASDQKQTTSGHVLLGDVYTLENNLQTQTNENKLILKIESEDVTHDTALYVNSDSTFDDFSSKRKTTLAVGILILILLIFSVAFGINQKKKKDFNIKSEEKLNTSISNYEKSISEVGVDKVSSKRYFMSSKEIALKLKEDGYKSEKLDKLLSDINKKESEILGELKVDPKELLDLTLQINGFNGDRLVSTGETMFVLDKNNKNIIQVDSDGKGAKIAAGKDILDGVIDIASYQDRLFTLNNDGIYEIDGSRTKIKEPSPSETSWVNSLFYLYSGNIYLVDKDANQIYRFAGNNNIFADKSEWLAPGIEADFSKIKDISIDGSIWLLSSSGKVTKFTNGNPNSILMNGITENIENPTAIYTNEKLKYTYILDREKGRVVLVEKNGDFKIQYTSDQIKNAKDLVVPEKENKIILLTGSKLNYIEIKN